MKETLWPVNSEHKEFIYQIISFESEEYSTKSLDFYADGFPGLVYFHTEGKVTIYAGSESKEMDPFFVYGQTLEPIKIEFNGPFRMVMLQLFPSVIDSVFRIPISELTNSCWTIPINTLNNINGINNINNSKNTHQLILILLEFIINKTRNLKVDIILHECIRIIVRNKGDSDLKALCNQFQMSERTLQRRFESKVGLSPKQFANIIKFQNSLNLISNSNEDRLTDVAYEGGYFDQSHFIRQFKSFTKQKPFRFRKKN